MFATLKHRTEIMATPQHVVREYVYKHQFASMKLSMDQVERVHRGPVHWIDLDPQQRRLYVNSDFAY